ncbi:hypothetical protein [Natrarchaeobius halalkaliphilus]|nr:hypothetical protein [Natrarchaeobius halalkaliphilus]
MSDTPRLERIVGGGRRHRDRDAFGGFVQHDGIVNESSPVDREQ